MSNLLTVCFQWKLRKRSQASTTDLDPIKSQSTVYRQKIKSSAPEKFNAMKEADRKRKRVCYKNVQHLTTLEKNEQRDKWRQAKMSQRDKLSKSSLTNEQQQDCHQRKRMKMLTSDERKIYNRNKQKESRSRKNKHRKSNDRKKDRERKIEPSIETEPVTSINKGKSRATLFRRARDIRRQLPNSQRAYAQVLDKVFKSASPKKKAEVEKHGIKRKLADSFISVARSLQAEMYDLRKNKLTEDRRQHYKYLVHAACQSTDKHRRMKKKVAALLGIGGKVLRNKRIQRKIRKDVLPQITKQLAQDFWRSEGVSREVPLKKRVKKGEPPFLLECSYTEAYRRFKSTYPNTKMGYCKFITCRPKNVMLMKASERIVCCCVKCENTKLKVQALNKEVIKRDSPDLRIKHVDDLAAKTVCPPVNGQLSIKCLKRECTHCGAKAVQLHYLPLMQVQEYSRPGMTFDQWCSTPQEITFKSKGKAGEIQKKLVRRLKRVTTVGAQMKDVTDLLLTDMVTYPAHKFRADWQMHQFHKLKSNMPPHSAILVIDFAMNYTCFLQDEVQAYHWSPPQVTIHPSYAYVNNSGEVAAPTHTESINVISPDLQHDADAVATFVKLCSEHLKEGYPGITSMYQFSDCCASQYRCSTSFADISFSQVDMGMNVQRNYFESSHGKSPADGQGAVIKRAATMAVTRREVQIRSAEEFYNFCQQKLTDVGSGVYPSRQMAYQNAKRSFLFVTSENINRNRPARHVKPVIGTMSIHCVKGSGTPYGIQLRELSCFCDHCLNGVGNVCEDADIVGSWRNVQLKTKVVVERAVTEKPRSDDCHHDTDNTVDDDATTETDNDAAIQIPDSIAVDNWVAVIYDSNWWPGVVESIEHVDEDDEVYCIKFMKPCDSSTTIQNRFAWPMAREEVDRLPRHEILTIIKEPPMPVTRRHYCFSDVVYQSVQRVFHSV